MTEWAGRLRRERGEAGSIILYVAIIAIVWTVLYMLIGWIYGTKEDRVEQGRKRHSRKYATPTPEPERGPDGYQVRF